jgi:hypothetical protein
MRQLRNTRTISVIVTGHAFIQKPSPRFKPAPRRRVRRTQPRDLTVNKGRIGDQARRPIA